MVVKDIYAVNRSPGYTRVPYDCCLLFKMKNYVCVSLEMSNCQLDKRQKNNCEGYEENY